MDIENTPIVAHENALTKTAQADAKVLPELVARWKRNASTFGILSGMGFLLITPKQVR